MKLKIALMALITSLALGMAGCAKEEGPMEKMGKSLDETADNMKDAAEDAADDMKKAVEE